MRDLSGAQLISQQFIDEEQPIVKSFMATFTNVAAKLSSTLRVCYFRFCLTLGTKLTR